MSQEDHDRAVKFLEDTCRLDELLAESIPPYVIYEPVIMTKREQITIGDGSRIDSFVKIEGGTGVRIGRYVHIASHAHIGIGGGSCELGDYSAVASGGKVISGSNQPDAISMSACAPREMQRVVSYKTVIERYAVVLTNAVVLPGRTLHEGAMLAAGAVATKDIPAWEIWGGNPARFLARRILR
jgi:UDP-2-acetamido-3-amino-2,3-dideoxy-glucuronate N-acetyltransferase